MLERIAAREAVAGAGLVIATFLLLTMGGAIVAAPLTAPLLYGVSRVHTGWVRAVAVIVVTLTTLELAWAITYVTLGESKPWIWAIPLVAGLATIAFVLKADRHQPANGSYAPTH